LKLVGAKNDTAVAGIAYFDDVSMSSGIIHQSPIDSFTFTVTDTEAVFATVASEDRFFELGSPNTLRCIISAYKTAGTGESWSFKWRIKVGANVSNEVEVVSTTESTINGIAIVELPAGTLGTLETVELQFLGPGPGSVSGSVKVWQTQFAQG
jgi:hypothetical protein